MFERNVDANPFKMESVNLTLIWVGFLGVRFEVGVGVKITCSV